MGSETSAGMPVLPHHWTLRHLYTGAGQATAATVYNWETEASN